MIHWFASPTISSKQMLVDAQKAIRKGIYEIERERNRLIEREAARTVEIRNTAAKGQTAVVRIMAKDLVRIRQGIAKFYQIQAELESVNTTMATMNSIAVMGQAMTDAARSLQRMNAFQSLPSLQRVLQTFAKEHSLMDMKQEVMNDAMDMALDTGDTETDQEAVINQVLDEIGIKTAGSMPEASAGSKGKAEAGVDDITARLEKLRK